MSDGRATPKEGSTGRLDDRVLATLRRLPGEIAFNGLRRVLGAHPESLARALRRLERDGLVLRSRAGYRVPEPPPTTAASREEALHVVAEVELADALRAPELLTRLVGRWFGSLRWVGVIDRRDERLLAWAPQGGVGMVLLGADRGRLRVMVPDRLWELDATEAEEEAFELLVHAVEALRGPSDRGGTARPLTYGLGGSLALLPQEN